MYLRYLLVCLLAYLIGNFSTSYVIAKCTAHIDIRKYGSGNAGTTNVLRVLGTKAAAVTFAGDILKAVAAVLLGRYIAGGWGQIIAGIAVVIGHNWPVLLGFRGGKGIASTIGIMLVINPVVVLICAALGVLILATTRYVSLASLTGICIFPVVMLILRQPLPLVLFSFALAAMAVYRHWANIQRLLKGTEPKIGQKSKAN